MAPAALWTADELEAERQLERVKTASNNPASDLRGRQIVALFVALFWHHFQIT